MNANANLRQPATDSAAPTPERISPAEVFARLQSGSPCRIVDVRTRAEWEAAHVADATLQPLDVLVPGEWAPRDGDAPLYVLCQAGGRASRAASLFCSAGVACAVIDGGLDAWRAAGLPVVLGNSRVLPLMRQVQIVIGAVTGVGSALAVWRHPLFGLIPLMMGAGLLFAGLSGTCGLALLMARLPWNRGSRDDRKPPGGNAFTSSCCNPKASQ